jgi:DNA-binding transcriptional MerR regulator
VKGMIIVMEIKYYQIDEVSEKTGLTKRMLRYYEEIGLIIPTRKESGYRLYTDDDLKMLKSVKETKDKLGFSMNDLKAFSSIEKKIISVVRGEKQDKDSIKLCKEETKRLLKLVEEKEETIVKVKSRLSRALAKLDNL